MRFKKMSRISGRSDIRYLKKGRISGIRPDNKLSKSLGPGFLMVEWREPVITGENRRGEQRVEKESGRHVERERGGGRATQVRE